MSDLEAQRYEIKCPLCSTKWTEPRQRGCCPGCGASLNEMLRAYTDRARLASVKVKDLSPMGGVGK